MTSHSATPQNDQYYEKDDIVVQYCEFHYGDEYLGVPNFTKQIATIAEKYAVKRGRVLDMGCAVGRSCFELAKHFDEVVGIDFSARFINVAETLKRDGVLRYEQKIEGELTKPKEVSLADFGVSTAEANKVQFWQGDACNLKPHFTGFDMIVAINLVDRLYDPMLFLQDVPQRLNDGGILIVGSPFTWSEEYVKKEHWLGGKYANDEARTPIESMSALSKALEEHFEKVTDPFDVEFVIQEHIRKYQHSFSKFSVWRKK